MANEPTEKLAQNAMTTLEDTMERLGIPEDSADTTVKNNIIRLINSASAWVETVTGRKFGKAVYTDRYAGPGTQELFLKQYPIRSVEYVKDTTAGAFIEPESYDFTMTGNIGVLSRDAGWNFKGYVGGLAGDYYAAQRYLEVKYTAGYVLPKDGTAEEPADLPADRYLHRRHPLRHRGRPPVLLHSRPGEQLLGHLHCYPLRFDRRYSHRLLHRVFYL